MNWTWKTGTTIGMIIAAICVATGVLFARGLGLDDFWTGLSVGFLSVICFGIAVMMSKKRTVSASPARTVAHSNRG